MVYVDYDNPRKQLDHIVKNNEGTKLFDEMSFVFISVWFVYCLPFKSLGYPLFRASLFAVRILRIWVGCHSYSTYFVCLKFVFYVFVWRVFKIQDFTISCLFIVSVESNINPERLKPRLNGEYM